MSGLGLGASARGSAPLTEAQRLSVQRRTLAILATGTILGGLGIGAGFSAGALLVTEITGTAALSGFAATMNAVGAAIAGIPLGRLAARRGRRVALATGNLIAVLGAIAVIASAALGSGPLLFLGLAVLGIATAVQLQSRFAAADLAMPGRRARDLSLVVWSITVGAVVGPNLIGPGANVGVWLGLPPLAGVFAFSLLAQAAAGAIVWFGLRPDPLLAAREIAAREQAAAAGEASAAAAGGERTPSAQQRRDRTRPRASTLVIALVAAAHAVMVAIMAMTPLHITEHGGSITLVGLTISLHIAGMYALSPIFGMLTGRIGAVRVILIGFLTLFSAVACTAFAGDSHLVVQTGLVLLGVGWSAVTVAGAALLTEVTPPDARPRRQGQSDTVMNACGALAGASSGALFAFAGFPFLSLVGGFLVAVGIACTLRLLAVLRR